jgi:hypothetical protein
VAESVTVTADLYQPLEQAAPLHAIVVTGPAHAMDWDFVVSALPATSTDWYFTVVA